MGRSSGGGSHSSGGFSSSRSSGGFSGGGRSSSSYSRSSSSRSSSRPRSQPYRSTYGGPRYYGAPRPPRAPRPYRRSSLAVNIMVFIILLVITIFVLISKGSSNVQKSTKNREPLSGVVSKTDWYEDDLGWIRNKRDLVDGLEDFYNETGIQPYVMMIPYADEYWNGSTLNPTKADEYLEKVYKNKFKDEGHFIFAYFSCRNDSQSEMDGEFRYVSGFAADSIMDDEALKIFWGYFEKNYYNTSLSIEEMISDTFSSTADSIMSRATNGWDFAKIAIMVGGVVGVIVVVYLITKIKAKRAKEKEDYTKEILDKPLETFSTDTSDLEEKYK